LNKDLHKQRKSRVRQEALDGGYYDGRFRTKTIPNKKHKDGKYKKRFDPFNED